MLSIQTIPKLLIVITQQNMDSDDTSDDSDDTFDGIRHTITFS